MKKRILLVEDDNVSFAIGKMLFEASDCVIDHAASGEEAIQLFAKSLIDENEYHAIYMDIGLPEMSGIDTCIKIREYETEIACDFIPIIAVTANDNQGMIDECCSVGMMGVIFKPLTPEKVAQFLEKCHL